MCALPSLSVLALARASDLGSAFVPKIYLVLRFMHDSPKLFWFHPASFISSSRASCAFEIHVTLLSNFRFRLRPVFCAQLAHLRARTHATPSNSMRQVSSQDFAREPGLSQQKRRKARPLQPSLHFQRRAYISCCCCLLLLLAAAAACCCCCLLLLLLLAGAGAGAAGAGAAGAGAAHPLSSALTSALGAVGGACEVAEIGSFFG